VDNLVCKTDCWNDATLLFAGRLEDRHTYLALPAKPEVKVEHRGETLRLSLRVV